MTVAAMIKAEEGADVGQPQPQKQHQEWTAPDAPKVELSFKGVIAPDEVRMISAYLNVAHEALTRASRTPFPPQLVSLHVLYGDILVCPGLIGAFGSRIDPKGRLRIPGALTGVREAKRCLKGWKKRADESEKLVWWLQKLKERDTEPVTASTAAIDVRERSTTHCG